MEIKEWLTSQYGFKFCSWMECFRVLTSPKELSKRIHYNCLIRKKKIASAAIVSEEYYDQNQEEIKILEKILEKIETRSRGSIN